MITNVLCVSKWRCLLSLAIWQWVFLCRTVWDCHWCAPLVEPAEETQVVWENRGMANTVNRTLLSMRKTREGHSNHTLMCVMRAGALCIPAGTHFLLEGRASSLPNRFHIPSTSRGVRWTLTAGFWACCSEASSSLPWDSSSSFTCSLAISAPGGFFRPDRKNEPYLTFTRNLQQDKQMKKLTPFVWVHTDAKGVFLKFWC